MATAQDDEVGLTLQGIRALRAGALARQSHVEMPYVEMYHRDLDRLEAAGHDVDGYRIPAGWLVAFGSLVARVRFELTTFGL
jgi:hypothetical protein